MNKVKSFFSGQVLIMTLVLLLAPALYCNLNAETQYSDVMYSYRVYKIDKAKLIMNLRSSVSSYLDNKRRNGWSAYYVEEFQHAYTRYMAALDDARNPYRFYTDDFGSMTDINGEFTNQDLDDYWYDDNGQRISGNDYNNLKDSKKTKYRQFNANMQFVKYFNIIADAMLKKRE